MPKPQLKSFMGVPYILANLDVVQRLAREYGGRIASGPHGSDGPDYLESWNGNVGHRVPIYYDEDELRADGVVNAMGTPVIAAGFLTELESLGFYGTVWLVSLSGSPIQVEVWPYDAEDDDD